MSTASDSAVTFAADESSSSFWMPAVRSLKLFLIDGQGNVVERYEGGIGLTELDPAVKQLVS